MTWQLVSCLRGAALASLLRRHGRLALFLLEVRCGDFGRAGAGQASYGLHEPFGFEIDDNRNLSMDLLEGIRSVVSNRDDKAE